MKTYIIVEGSQHYALYRCTGIKTRNHIHNLNVFNYSSRIAVKKEFKKLLSVINGKDKYTLEFKG